MLILTLTRESLHPASIGRLLVDGVFHSDTLERPWLDNQRGISCIPPGRYPVIMTVSPRFGRPMMRLADTAPRWGILIHAANEVEQLQGCIALGKRTSPHTLMESRAAVDKLQAQVRGAITEGESVFIDIINPKVTA